VSATKRGIQVVSDGYSTKGGDTINGTYITAPFHPLRESERAQVLQLGFDERFMRIWEFYLAYCEAAFAERSIDVVQYTLRKP